MSYFFRHQLMKAWGKEIREAWDEADHPRGKTTPESNSGSFAPKDGGGAKPSSATMDQLGPAAFDASPADIAVHEQRAREYAQQNAREASLAAREAERNAVQSREAEMVKRSLAYEPPGKIQVGAILRRSWGYDQTNINYYEVVGMTPSGKSVKIRELAQIDRTKASGAGPMSGHTRAVPGLYIGETLTRRVTPSGRVNFNDYSSLSLWDGKDDYHSWDH